MNLNTNETNLLESIFHEQHLPILEKHSAEINRIRYFLDINKKHRCHFEQVKLFARELLEARVSAYIQIYQRIKKYPDEPSYKEMLDDLNQRSKNFVPLFSREYEGVFSSMPKELLEGLKSQLSNELDQMFSFVIAPLRRFMDEANVPQVHKTEFSINKEQIFSDIFVLESEENMVQGTAFCLAGKGLVTCHHVLSSDLVLFHPSTPHQKYKVEILSYNSTIDVALISAPDLPPSNGLPLGSANHLEQLQDIVVTGYPNYRLGDTGIICAGKITGFRVVSGIRRMLVNIPIIAGNSGGPVFNNTGQVIGIAITGADRMENADNTENHGVVPIDTLSLLTV